MSCEVKFKFRIGGILLKISTVGAVISAENRHNSDPLHMVDAKFSSIERIVVTLQQSSIFPIVVITGQNTDSIRKKLAKYGVVLLQDTGNNYLDLIDTAKIGFSFLKNLVDKLLFFHINTPFFTSETVDKLLVSNKDIAIPSYANKAGHPIAISNNIIDKIINFEQEGGLRKFIELNKQNVEYINVDDPYILYNTNYDSGKIENISIDNGLHMIVKLELGNPSYLVDARTKLLLFLLLNSYTVTKACNKMSISTSTAWKLINELEYLLKTQIVIRRQGGKGGGETVLSPKGVEFLQFYQRLEERIFKLSKEEFLSGLNHLNQI